jgi:hypothetical protein
VLGNVIYIATQLFPFVVMFLLQYKYDIRYQNKFVQNDFALVYEILYENLRTETYGPFQYYTVYLLRKLIFANMVYYLSDEVFTLLQIFVNCLLSLLFALFLAYFQPFIDKSSNRINLVNEICFYSVSLLYFCFTDFNPEPEVKVNCGWFVMIILIANLIWPNAYTMATGIWPEIKAKCARKRRNFLTNKQLNSLRRLE